MSWFFIITLFLFFLLRLPSLFEPLWYGDEGVYQAIGMALNNGSLLYKGIWDNKPPLVYLVYALFHSDQFTVRLVSLIFGLLSVPVFFFLSKKLFSNLSGSRKIYYLTTSVFALLFALPVLEGNIANAENFMMLPILIAALLVVKVDSLPSVPKVFLLFAGTLLGVAFLFKVVAVFDFAAFFLFLLFSNLGSISKRHSGLSRISHHLEQRKGFWSRFGTHRLVHPFAPQNDEKEVLKQVLKRKLSPFLFGFFLPIVITVIFFAINGAFFDFVRATFSSNIGYVGWQNKWIFPQGLLLLKTILLIMLVILIVRKRGVLAKNTIFILLWFVFSLFNAFFAERPYTHYLLTLLPSFVLMIGLIIWERNYKKPLIIFFIVAFVLIIKNFNFYGKTTTYYQNFTSFILGQKSVSSYRSFFDKKTPIDYEIAMFIKSKIKEDDSIFVWGNNAQLYKMTESIPLTKYIVAYHITGYKDGLANIREVIERTKPRFIIIMPDQKPIPIVLTHYSERFNINRVAIYESFF